MSQDLSPITPHEVNSTGASSNSKHKTRKRVGREHSDFPTLQECEVFICKSAECRKASAKACHQKELEVRRQTTAFKEESRENTDAKATEYICDKGRPREARSFWNHK